MAKPTKSNKTDRRIQRTRQALRTALLELTKEKDYDSISIEEITERANVGRATFYLHYKDKEDLLLEQFSEMANEKVQLISEIPFTDWLSDPKKKRVKSNEAAPLLPLLIVFQHIYDNHEFYHLLMKSENSSRIVERIRKISTDSIVKFVETKMQTDPIPLLFEVPIEFFASFFSGAFMSSINWWLEEDMRHSPEEVAKMFRKLFFRGASETLGIPIESSKQ
jgi:AcrR family transcriptional regulator